MAVFRVKSLIRMEILLNIVAHEWSMVVSPRCELAPSKFAQHITELAPQLTKFASKVDRVHPTIKQTFSFVVNQ